MSSISGPVTVTRMDGRAALRTFFVGGLISYKALFNFFQILFFSYVGRSSGVENDQFFVVGNAVQVCAMSCIYGMTMTIANEREFGTLSPLLASPANRIALFLGRSLAPIANGLVVSAFGFTIGTALLDVSLPPSVIPALALVVLVTVISCTALGMAIGSLGLRAKDVFFLSNLAYFLMLLLCGVNVPLEALPGWMETIGRSVPLTHGIAAARDIASGAPLSSVGHLIRTEAQIGVLYAVLAFGMFRFFEREGRRTGSLTHL
jgi:ABC-2 type transport system permease protein